VPFFAAVGNTDFRPNYGVLHNYRERPLGFHAPQNGRYPRRHALHSHSRENLEFKTKMLMIIVIIIITL
jgi:hypothetical protein